MSSGYRSVAKTLERVAYCNKGERSNGSHEDKGGQSSAVWDTREEGTLHNATSIHWRLTIRNKEHNDDAVQGSQENVAGRNRGGAHVITILPRMLNKRVILHGTFCRSMRRFDGTGLA